MSRIPRILAVLVAAFAVTVSTVLPVSAASASVSQSSSGITRALGDAVPSDVVKSSLTGFNPGNIISDAVFTNKNTMTEAQIQAFFNSKVKTCRGGSDKYGPIVCLKDFTITSVNRPADTYCDGYTGAKNETAARIIYRVAQSCGINPQVLIVMLQKEQSLVTHTWPSAWRYDKALGQGCPDGGVPCNPSYVGFFHQIYGAARQMQTYLEGKHFTWYAPGKTWNILYHPNRSCGTSPVKVANKATSALYYYTPYQPNAAALRAGYGTGDSCSSYGNRNFYNYFTDWFGPTQGGGTPTTPPAFPVSGAIATEWKARGGATGKLGSPLAAVQVVKDPNGDGLAQKFTGGWIHSSKTGTFTSWNEIMTGYSAVGWLRGEFGWPVSNQVCQLGICTQPFEGGIISYPLSGGAAKTTPGVTPDAIAKEYAARGGAKGQLGAAVGALQIVSDVNGNGLARKYAKGWIHSSAAGTYSSSSTVMTAYSAAGWLRGDLGWPTGAETCSGTLCSQPFQGGMIAYWKGQPAVAMPGVGAEQMKKVLASKRSGGLGAALLPVQLVSDPNGNGLARKYAGGWIHSSERGTFTTSSKLMPGYSAAGWLRGFLGWPTRDEQIVEDPNGNGRAQQFEGGWIHASDAGSFASSSRIMTEYSAQGWLRGELGWPVRAEQIVTDPNGNGVAQAFQGGWIHSSAAGTFTTSSDLMPAYSAAGWLRGHLGWPIRDQQIVEDPNGNGVAQAFRGGWIHFSKAGAFASSTRIMTAYSAAGWIRGDLGWPTGREICSGDTCSQKFQGGTISYKGSGPAKVTYR